MYNTTGLDASNNFIELFVAVNDLSGQLLASIIMLVLFILIMMVFSNYDKKVVLMADSFFLIILGVLFFAANLIGWQILIAPIVIFFISLLVFKLYG